MNFFGKNSKKNIFVLTMSERQSKYEVGRIMEEAKKLGVKVTHRLYKDLVFKNEKVFINDQEVNKRNTSGVIFRVAGTVSGKYIEARNLLISSMKDELKILNAKTYLWWPRMGKIPQLGAFLKNNIPIIPTKIFYKKEDVLKEKWSFPIIVKNSMGFQGKNVIKISNKKELEIL